jgi:hypothetical protein
MLLVLGEKTRGVDSGNAALLLVRRDVAVRC